VALPIREVDICCECQRFNGKALEEARNFNMVANLMSSGYCEGCDVGNYKDNWASFLAAPNFTAKKL
jgi:hypothetical protein